MYTQREGYSTQDALFRVIEQRLKTTDKQGKVIMVPMELPKGNNCIPVLPAKQKTLGFCLESLNLRQTYLTNGLQRVKVNGNYSYWQQLRSGVPQD